MTVAGTELTWRELGEQAEYQLTTVTTTLIFLVNIGESNWEIFNYHCFTPGDSTRLVLTSPLYVGGVPPASGPHPPSVYSATLNQGYVGCLRDLVLNGMAIQLAEVAISQDSGRNNKSKSTKEFLNF